MSRQIEPHHVTSLTYGKGDLLTVWRYDGREQVMQPVPKPQRLNIAKPEQPFSFWLGVEGHWGYNG